MNNTAQILTDTPPDNINSPEINALERCVQHMEDAIIQKVLEHDALKTLLQKKRLEASGHTTQEEVGDRFWSQFRLSRRSQPPIRFEESGVSSLFCPSHVLDPEDLDR